MTKDDAAELVKLETRLSQANGLGSAQLAHVVPWLVRLVRELEARVVELEAGDIDEIIDAKNAEIAKRDAHAAELSARLAKLEADKLPSPDDYYRQREKLPEPVEAKPAARKTRKKSAKNASK